MLPSQFQVLSVGVVGCLLSIPRHLSVCEKMCPWMPHQHCSMVTLMLGITFITISYDLAWSRMGAQAWTYNYTTDTPMNWDSARRYCQAHFTDMVAIQNQAEIAYLNDMLPRVRGYYWIGIRKVEEKWTWVGTGKALTPEAENWAMGEPNNLGDGQDCVEIYIKREKDTAKWNDENCAKKKGAICYTASCSEVSCSEFGECEETIGNFSCRCEPGFEGPRCDMAVACGPLVAPEQGSVSCVHAFGENRYNSSCRVDCKPGFQLLGAAQSHCQATGHWDQHTPSCKAVECPAVPDAPSGGSVNCSHPIAPHSFTSTCEFRCDEGFLLQGAHRIQCDPTGQWTHSAPICKAVECPAISDAPSGGRVNCSHPIAPHSFTSTCEFRCDEGFLLQGAHSIQCDATSQWTHSAPVCKAVECPAVVHAPRGGRVKCSHPIAPHSFTSTCEFRCDEGFLLQGAHSIQCDATGQWNNTAPICRVVECPEMSDAPSGGSVNCSHPIATNSFTSTCEFRCDEGFLLQGAHRIQCDATGQWNNTAPICKAVQCEQLKALSNGKLNCLDPLEKFSYSSTCWSKCDSGYILKGSNSTHCSAHGQWSHALPVCQVVECPEMSDAPSGGSVNCSHPIAPHSFTSTCEFRCDEGFLLQGAHRIQCDPTGQWNNTAPICKAVPCEQLNALSHGKLNCLDPFEKFSYSSTCWSECDSGYILKGSNSTHCPAHGKWSHALPDCQVVECPEISDVPSGISVNCSHPIAPHSFTSTCEFRCDEGFLLQGAPRIQCDPTGQWTPRAPNCKVREMSLGAALLMYTAVGSASAAGLLGLIGVILLAKRMAKKASNGDSLWNAGINPVFEGL
ncbi:hypothetical protein ACEWY4_014138 [Coilia grayii]|uniref:E-selectin n=1 Tax=Coilia grayii TaxID=363190 RepID=A0ABD1JRL3_9TELE